MAKKKTNNISRPNPEHPEGRDEIPPTINNVPVIQKLAYIHRIKIPNSPTIKSPGV